MKFNKEIRVGLLALITGVMLYTGFNFLKGIDFFSSANRYYVVYDNIGGLNVSSPVMVSGFNVGRVEYIKLLPENGYKLLVTLQIDKNLLVNDSSIADLIETSALGDKAVEIKIGKGKNTLKNGDTLWAKTEKGMIASLHDKMSPILNNVDSITFKTNKILGNNLDRKIISILNNVNNSTEQLSSLLAETRPKIGAIATDIHLLTSSLKETEKSIKPLIAKLNTVGDSLNKAEIAATVNNANKTVVELKLVLDRINRGEGTLGKLAKNDSLYTNLNNTAADLDKLLVNFREEPKRYVHFSVFGKKDKKK